MSHRSPPRLRRDRHSAGASSSAQPSRAPAFTIVPGSRSVGVENTDIPKGSFPKQIVMLYSPDYEGWFISDTIDLVGQEGAPLC